MAKKKGPTQTSASGDMSWELSRVVDALSYAFLHTELNMAEQVCTEAAEITWKLLQDAGWESIVIGVPGKALGNVPPHQAADHELVRVRDIQGVEWNLDFAAQQFGRPLPFITMASSPEAIALYGKGSVSLGPGYTTRDWYTVEQMTYPPVEWVDEADGDVDVLGQRWGDETWLARLMADFVRSFRWHLEVNGG